MIEPVNRKPLTDTRLNWIKWLIWVLWIPMIGFTLWRAGGVKSVDFLHGTEGGISVAAQPDRPIIFAYVIYFGVLLLITGIRWWVGHHGFCHTVCWMAPFMISRHWLRNLVKWPSLRLQPTPDNCTECHTCTRNCPMSLDVTAMVKGGDRENSACILCGMRIDECSHSAIRYAFQKG